MALYKEQVENTCIECGAPARAVKVAKNTAAKEAGALMGMVWDCPNGHINRHRKYVIKEVKIG